LQQPLRRLSIEACRSATVPAQIEGSR
jgi:hypothetical protein